MKKIIFTLSLILTYVSVNAQKIKKQSNGISLGNRFTFISPKKDTLYVANNDMGNLTKWIWDNDKFIKEKKPEIIVISEKQLLNIIILREKKDVLKNPNKIFITKIKN